MHKDVLEFFIIANSVPVLHLFQSLDGDADSVLRAGRISAQDVLGEETTGELIQKEVLSNSAIYYGRSQEILVALRVTSSMSDKGTRYLLKKALALCENYKNLIFRSFGDRSTLRPLTERLDLLLGNKFPTNPVIMGKINTIMSNAIQNLEYLDRLAIVTAEGWVVNIVESDRTNIGKISKFAWKNAVEMLHLSLGLSNNGVIVSDEDSIWFLYPLRFKDPQTPTGNSWWGLIVQINRSMMQSKNETSQQVPERIQNEINENMIRIVEPLVINMLEKESRLFGLIGPLGKLFSFPDYLDENPIQVNITENLMQVFEEQESKTVKIFEKIVENDLFHEVVSLFDSIKTSTAFFTLSEDDLFAYAQHLISLENHRTPITVSFGAVEPSRISDFWTILQSRLPNSIKILSEMPLTIPHEKEMEFIQVSSQAQTGGYFVILIDQYAFLIAVKDATQKYYTLFSKNKDFIDLAKNTIQQLVFL